MNAITDRGPFWGAGWLRSVGRALAATAALCVETACSDGYPTQDTPALKPAEMTQAQRLARMNQIGNQAHVDRRWRYGLGERCELTVTFGRFFNGQSFSVSLDGAQIRSSVDETDKSYDVHVLPRNGLPTPVVSVLEGGRWPDAVQMRSLLQHTQRDCRASSGAGSEPVD